MAVHRRVGDPVHGTAGAVDPRAKDVRCAHIVRVWDGVDVNVVLVDMNVVVVFAHGDGICQIHDATDISCPPNYMMDQWLKGWGRHGNPMLFYDYPPSGMKFDK